MKKGIFFLLIAFTSVACKLDQKEAQEVTKNINESSEKNTKKNLSFEDRLIDLRGVNQEFNENLKVDKFGMRRVNDSIYEFVLNLNPSTSEETVNTYSYGVKGFYSESEKPFKATFSPNITEVDNQKYLILRKKIKNIKYFDSLDMYIYERNNWKKSGRLGGIKIKDILLEK